MTDYEKEIIKSIKEMGVLRTPFKPLEVSAVVAVAIKALEQRKTGRWKKAGDVYECSECGWEYYDKMQLTNYCPSCGSQNVPDIDTGKTEEQHDE